MQINLRALSVTLILAGVICAPALAAIQPDNASQILLSGAQKWVDRDRTDLAKNLLNKLLLIHPSSPEALLMLGKIEAKNGKTDVAQGYLQRLQQSAPDSPQTRELQASLHPSTTAKSAAALPQKNDPLAALEAQSADPKQIKSALAGFEELSGRRDVDTQRLQKAWRRSLHNYHDQSNKQLAIKRYLDVYPNDKEMIALLGNTQRSSVSSVPSTKRVTTLGSPVRTSGKRKIAKQPPPTPALPESHTETADSGTSLANDPDIIARTDALDALSDGNLELAETSLLDIIKRRPEDPEVSGGLGLIKQKQAKYIEAQQWFERALASAQKNKSDTPKWESLIAAAKIGQYSLASEEAIDKNQLAEAETYVQQWLTVKPGDPDGLAMMGNVRAAGNQFTEAEQFYREALKTESYNVSAIRGLVSVLSRTGRSDEALQLVEQTLQENKTEWRKSPYKQASLLREEASLYIAAHRTSHAIQSLEMAVLLDPKNAHFYCTKWPFWEKSL